MFAVQDTGCDRYQEENAPASAPCLSPCSGEPERSQRALATMQSMELVEPLTDRELEVLALLARRMSSKEIAQALIISPLTVKRHTSNIYSKLQVGGRREAVAKAALLGLL